MQSPLPTFRHNQEESLWEVFGMSTSCERGTSYSDTHGTVAPRRLFNENIFPSSWKEPHVACLFIISPGPDVKL